MKQQPSSVGITADIQRMVNTILRVGSRPRIILFGSKANGTAQNDSDSYLLIAQPEDGAVHSSRWKVLDRIRSALRDIPVAKDLLL